MSKTKQVKIPVDIRPTVKITKLTDDVFNGNHPNGIYEGHTVKGTEINPPKVGDRYEVVDFNSMSNRISTSIVKEIIDKNTIKTTYSTYRIEYL